MGRFHATQRTEGVSTTELINRIIANYENTEVKDRFFREKFVFKNIEYDKNKPYFLVITDEATGIELPRVKFFIDIAIVNNFDF